VWTQFAVNYQTIKIQSYMKYTWMHQKIILILIQYSPIVDEVFRMDLYK